MPKPSEAPKAAETPEVVEAPVDSPESADAELQSELDEFLNVAEGKSVESPEADPVVEEPVEEPAVEEPKEPVVEEPAEQEPVIEQPTPEETDAYAKLQKQYDEDTTKLREALANMTAQPLVQKQPGQPQQPPAPAAQGQRPTSTDLSLEIDEATYDKMFEDRAVFNKVMVDLLNKAAQKNRQDITPIVQRTVSFAVSSADKARTFFTENSDLIPYRRFTAFETRRIETEHPDWSEEQILAQVEADVRTTLRLPKNGNNAEVTQTGQKVVERTSTPSRPATKPAARSDQKVLSKQEEEFKAILPPGFQLKTK